MYQYTRRQITNIIIAIARRVISVDIKIAYDSGVPYWELYKMKALEEMHAKHVINKLFHLITKIYGTKILLSPNKYSPTTRTYFDYNNELKPLTLDKAVVLNKHVTFTINGFRMYQDIDQTLYRTLLWYLIDPLAYIDNINLDKTIFPEAAIFFRTVKKNIKSIDSHHSLVWWVLKCHQLDIFLVLDILDYVLDIYIQCSLHQINRLITRTKSKLYL